MTTNPNPPARGTIFLCSLLLLGTSRRDKLEAYIFSSCIVTHENTNTKDISRYNTSINHPDTSE